MIYDETNITETIVDCETCTAPCYKLIDCAGVGNHPTVSTPDLAFSAYVGQVISWIDDADAPDFIERCAIVEEYVCRKESYPTPVITVMDCFKTCTACQYVEPEPEEPAIVTGRTIIPGYDVADCNPVPKCPTCE